MKRYLVDYRLATGSVRYNSALKHLPTFLSVNRPLVGDTFGPVPYTEGLVKFEIVEVTHMCKKEVQYMTEDVKPNSRHSPGPKAAIPYLLLTLRMKEEIF